MRRPVVGVERSRRCSPGARFGFRRRVNIFLDGAVIEHFKSKASDRGYQALINEALKQAIRAEMPGRLRTAFKGGTSLSKVFDAVDRFSEDVDVTLDYHGFSSDIDPTRPSHRSRASANR